MKVDNKQIEPVLGAIASVMSGVVLPVHDAGAWAEAIVDLGAARKRVMLMEQPVFVGAPLDDHGNPVINEKDNPEGIAQVSAIRNAECPVDIPTITMDVIKAATGEANPIKLALLLEVGIVTRAEPEIDEVIAELQKAGCDDD